MKSQSDLSHLDVVHIILADDHSLVRRGMAALLGWNELRIQEEIESVLCRTALPEHI